MKWGAFKKRMEDAGVADEDEVVGLETWFPVGYITSDGLMKEAD